MDEKVYNEKREQLQKYVPFLQKLIKKMKEKTIPQHYPLLNKMEILYGLITASNKRLSPETINKCESSLRNLYIKLSDKELSKEDFKLEGLTIDTKSKQKPTNTKKTEESAPIKIKTEPNIKTEKEDEQEAPTSKSTQSTPNTGSTPVVVKKEVEDSSKKKSGNEDASKKAKAADSRVSTAASNAKDSSKGSSNKETAKKVQKSKESPKEVNSEPSKSPTPPKRKTEADSQSESCDIAKKIKVEKDVDTSPSPKIVIIENKEIPKLHEGQAITKEMLGGILSNVLDSRLVKDLVEKIFAKPNEGTKSLKQRVKTEIVEVDADSQIHEIFDDDDILLVEDDNTVGNNSKEKGGKVQNSKATEKAEQVIKDKQNSRKTTEEDVSIVLDAQIEDTEKQNGETEIIDLDEEENGASEPNENPATKERTETEIVFETCVISDLPDKDNTGIISKVIEPPEEAIETNEKKTEEDEKQSKTVGQVKQKKAVKRRNGASKQRKQTKTIKQTCDTSKQENVDEAKQSNKEKTVSEPSKEENLEEEKQSTTERQASEDPKQESIKQGKQSKTVNTTNEPSKQETVAQKKQSKPAKPTHDATKPEKLEQGTQKKKRKSISNPSKPENSEQDNQNKPVRRTSDTFKEEKEEQTKPIDTGRAISDASKPENVDKGKQNKSVRPTNDASKQESEEPTKPAEKRMSISDAPKPENLEKVKPSRSGKPKHDASKQESVEQVKKTEKRMSISDASKPENLDKGKQNKSIKSTNDASKQESVEQAKKTEKRMSISDASKPENLDKGKQNKLVKSTNDATKQESVEQAKKTEKRMSISEASKPENFDKGKQNKLVKPTNNAAKQESVEQEKLDITTVSTNGGPKENGKKEEEESKQEEAVKKPEQVQEKVKTKEYEDNQIGKVKKLENNNLKITLKRKKSKDKTKAEKRARKESAEKSEETIDVGKDDSKEKSEEKSKINEEVVENPKKITEEPKEAESTNKDIPIVNDCKEESNETRVKEEVIENKEEDSTMDEINGNEEETGDKELANILEPLVLINDGTENGAEATTVVSVEPDIQHYSADGWTTDDEEETGLNKVHKKSKSTNKDNKVKKRKLMLDWPSFGSKKKKKNKTSQIPKKINFDLTNFNVANDILPKKFEIDVTLFKYDFRHLKNNKMNVRDFEILQRQVEKSFSDKTPPKNTDVNMLPDVLQCALCPHTDRFLPSHYVRFHSDSEVLVSRLPFEAVEALKSNLNNIPERVNKMHYRMMCQFCQTHLTFTTRAWRAHYMRHTGEYQFKCTTCNIHASQTSRFVNHKSYCKNPDIVQIRVWERCMKNVDAFVCDICNYIQMQEDGLRKHVATQHDTLVTYSHVVLVDVLGIMDGNANNSLVPEPPKQVQFIPNTNRDVHLKNPIYRRQCVLCDYNGPYIVKHYARTHHEGELFTARLSPETLENLKKDINNVAVKQKNEFLHVHVFQYRCPFCDLHFIFPAKSWIEHLGEHTGECKYQCNVCWRTAHNIEDFKQFDECPHTNITLDDEIYKKMKYIQYAFVCAFCNFTQLNKKRVENHLRLQHNFQLESIDDKISEVALLKFEGYDRFCNPFGETNPEMELNEDIMGEPPVGTAIPVVVSQRSESPTNSYDQSTPTNHSTAPRSENVWPYQNGVHLDQYGIVLTDDSLNSSTSTNLAMVSPNQSIESPISTNLPSTDSSPEGTSPQKGRPPKNGSQNSNSTITKPIVQSVSPLNVVPSVPISSNNNGSMAPPVTAMNTSSSANSNTFSSQFSRYAASRSSNHRDGFIDLTHLEEERMIASRQIDHRLHGQPIIRKVKNIGFCKDGIRQFYCLIQGCNFSTSMSYIIRDHIAKDHPKTVWDSYCFDCKGFTLLKRTYSCVTEYKHMLDMHVITDRADKAKSTFIITQFKDGNLPIKRVCNIGYTINEENKVFLYCLADGCKVKTPHMYTLLDHIDKIHQSILWDHYCEMCNRFVAPKGWALLRKELQHLQEKHTSPPKSPAERQQPVPPIVSVQPRLPTKTVMAQPRSMNNSPLNHLRTSICNGATSVTSLSNSVSLIAKSGNGKPTLKVRRLSGDNLSAQKALEAALGQQQHLTGQLNPGHLGPSIEQNKISTAPGVVIKQIYPPSGLEQHKATVQPQQMQNHLLSPDSTMHMNSNEIQEVDSAMLPPNPVKPWTRSLSVKMPEAAQKQVREVCLYALYKCMGSNCTYVTSCIENMRKHLGYHEQAAATAMSPSTNQSFYECPYCPLSVLNVTKLLDHIKGEHGRDLYQCPYCFYRSCDAQNVLTHLRLLHKDRNHLILLCNGEPRTLEAEFSMVMASLKANVEPLQCMKCRLNFFIIKSFVDHMTQIHGVQTNDGSINCGMCVRVKSSPDNLIKHLLTTHKKGYYECVYCAFATNTFELMAPHLAHVHNSKLPYVCVRKPKNETEVPTPGKQTLSNSTMLTCVVEQIESKRILKCPFAERELIFVSPMSANNNYTTPCSTSSPPYPNSMMGQQRLGPPPMEQMKSKGNGLQMSPSQMMSPGKQAMMHMNGQTHMSNVAPVRPQAINPHMPLNHRHPSSMDMSRYDNQYANPAPFYRAIFYPNMVQQNAMMPR